MLRISPVVLTLCLALLTAAGCTSFEVVRPPAREADLYPNADVERDIVIAIDEINEPRRVRSYFGVNLLEQGILPVQVVVSNRSRRRMSLKPSDVLVLRGRQVVDPLPIQRVTAIPKRRGLWVTGDTGEEIDRFYEQMAFREVILAPGESYRGMLFFEAERERPRASRFFRVVSLHLEPSLSLRIVGTDLENDERIGFGPYGIHPR